MRVRFERCQQIAGEVLYDAQRYIAGQAAPPGSRAVVVFNSESGPRTDFCTVRLPLEEGRLPAKLVDAEGGETPLQLLERGLRSPLDSRERVVVGFVAPDVPGFGYRAFRVEYGEPAPENAEARASPSRTSSSASPPTRRTAR